MKKPKIIIRLLIQVQQVLNTSGGKGGDVIMLIMHIVTCAKTASASKSLKM